MDSETLQTALEREHHEIDEGVEAFQGGGQGGGQERAQGSGGPAGGQGSGPAGGQGSGQGQVAAWQERVGALTGAMRALKRHIYLEEEILFPPLQEELAMPMMVMLREHGELWRSMDALEEQLENKPEGPELEAAMSAMAGALLGQLAQHNSKEEPIFYPKADTDLSEQDSAKLRAFIESGQMPPGWVCQRAYT